MRSTMVSILRLRFVLKLIKLIRLVTVSTAIAINEYRAPRWAEVKDSSGQPAYITLLQSHGSHTASWWIWLGVVWIIIGWAVFNIMTWFNHSFLNRALLY